MRLLITMFILLLIAVFAHSASAKMDPHTQDWKTNFATIPIQHQGRIMPMDTYARFIANEITGQTSWTKEDAPDGLAGRNHIEFLADLLFKPDVLFDSRIIFISRQTLKDQLGLDTSEQFFSAAELTRIERFYILSSELQAKLQRNPSYRPSTDEKVLMDVQRRITTMSYFVDGMGLVIAPAQSTSPLARVEISGFDPAKTHIHDAFRAMQDAYLNAGDMDGTTIIFIKLINDGTKYSRMVQSQIGLELFYNRHNPHRWAIIAILLAASLMALQRLTNSKWLGACVLLAISWTLTEQVLGVWLRVVIFDRAPVSNTYEALLWIGLVVIMVGIIGQAISPRSLYFAAGLGASLLAILFAALIPMTDQSNPLPAALRANDWLILHVLTIVTSYGVLLLAALLAHIYLIQDSLLTQPSLSIAKIITQIDRLMRIGVVLLAAGTILGGVWAANSWGRFWGWDPKETWSLISIMIYVVVLHARSVGWIKDFGLAATAIITFLAIVWTFYGVNYLTTSGLHTYGSGSGGWHWLAIWVMIEIVFLTSCWIRKSHRSIPKCAPSRGNHAAFNH